MPLVTCPDCKQPVSSEAIACATCARPMRDRSYLTPMGRILVGGLALIACIAWPPLWAIVLLVVVGGFVHRARRGSNANAISAGLVVLALTVGLLCAMPPSYSLLVFACGIGAELWLAAGRLATRSAA